MEYVFGTSCDEEVLKVKGDVHTDLVGFQQVRRLNEGQTILDSFRVVRKLESKEDDAGNCYDWYEIDRHYRVVDNTLPVKARVDAISAAIERGLNL